MKKKNEKEIRLRTHLLNGIKQHRNGDKRPRQIICLVPHGRHQGDPQARGFSRPAKAHRNRLLLGHLLDGEDALGTGRQAGIRDVRVDVSGQEEGRAGEVEAYEGEDDVQADVDEDVEDDVGLGQLVEGARAERARECGPVICVSISAQYNSQRAQHLVTDHTSNIKQTAGSFPSMVTLRTLATMSPFHHRTAWPTASGNKTLKPSCLATLAYMSPNVLGSAGRQLSKTEFRGMKPYINIGVRNDPAVFPMTTEMTAAASSPPADRVMTTLEAMVVGRQDVASMPRMMGIEGVPCERAPAARQMCTKTSIVLVCNGVLWAENSLSMNTGIITKLHP